MTRGVSLLQASLGSAVCIAIVAGAAAIVGQPLIAPPFGATALMCNVLPGTPSSAPRNVVVGHALGLLCGFAALAVTGALGMPSALAGGFRPEHVLAGALAVGATVATTEWLGVRHPPAAASTLIVSLGVLQKPTQLVAVACGAAALAATAWLVHRLCRVPYPAWAPADPG